MLTNETIQLEVSRLMTEKFGPSDQADWMAVVPCFLHRTELVSGLDPVTGQPAVVESSVFNGEVVVKFRIGLTYLRKVLCNQSLDQPMEIFSETSLKPLVQSL